MNKYLLLLKNYQIQRYCHSISRVQQQSPIQYCIDLVRKHDYENFLCTLLLPKDIRTAAFVIRAFNVEIAVIQDHTSENAISDMKYNFWNDTLKNIYNGTPPEAPVPMLLSRMLNIHKLSKYYFQRLLDTRWKKWQSVSFNDLSSIEQYAENTVSPIYYLLLEAKGIKNVHVDHAASHLGKAQGIVLLLRSIPYHAEKKRMILPKDILMNHGVSSESVFRGESSKALSDVVFLIASTAKQHLDQARSLKENIDPSIQDIFLPAATVNLYLKKIERVNFDIFARSLYRKENMLPFNLLWAKMFSKW